MEGMIAVAYGVIIIEKKILLWYKLINFVKCSKLDTKQEVRYV